MLETLTNNPRTSIADLLLSTERPIREFTPERDISSYHWKEFVDHLNRSTTPESSSLLNLKQLIAVKTVSPLWAAQLTSVSDAVHFAITFLDHDLKNFRVQHQQTPTTTEAKSRAYLLLSTFSDLKLLEPSSVESTDLTCVWPTAKHLWELSSDPNGDTVAYGNLADICIAFPEKKDELPLSESFGTNLRTDLDRAREEQSFSFGTFIFAAKLLERRSRLLELKPEDRALMKVQMDNSLKQKNWMVVANMILAFQSDLAARIEITEDGLQFIRSVDPFHPQAVLSLPVSRKF